MRHEKEEIEEGKILEEKEIKRTGKESKVTKFVRIHNG